MKSWWGKLLALGLIVALIVTLGACKNEDTNGDQENDDTNDIGASDDEKKEDFLYTLPLTGEGTNEEPNQRVVAVMLDNHPKASPHYGLNRADIVYEILAEGSITRYLALFQSERPEVIGPVRSLRPYNIDVAVGFDAILAHAGGSPDAKARVTNERLPSFDDTTGRGGVAFYRSTERPAPHNLMTGKDYLNHAEESFGYGEAFTLPTLKFKNSEEEMSGEAALWVEIEYNQTHYTTAFAYDEETQLYTRYLRDELHLDAETREPITVTNILVIEAHHQVLDEQGRRAINVTGEGNGYLFQRGKMKPVDWKYVDGIIRAYIDGEEVGLYPGQTWVNVVPNQGLENKIRYTSDKPLGR